MAPNRYGRQAMEHWRQWLPQRYSQLENPARFFTDLGLSVQEQITQLTTELAGPDPAGESYLDKVGRLNNARMRAEAIVVRQEVLLAPEAGSEPREDLEEDLEQLAQTPDQGETCTPVVEDRDSAYGARVREQDETPTH